MHGNVRRHNSRLTRKYLYANSVNPKEHIWDLLGRKVLSRHVVNNLKDFTNAVRAEWNNIPSRVMQGFVDYMRVYRWCDKPGSYSISMTKSHKCHKESKVDVKCEFWNSFYTNHNHGSTIPVPYIMVKQSWCAAHQCARMGNSPRFINRCAPIFRINLRVVRGGFPRLLFILKNVEHMYYFPVWKWSIFLKNTE